MKFTKFGKALLMSALSAGLILGVTSCVQSYTVGFLYVTGTITAQSGNNGIISGYKIDHNTGYLAGIHGLPVSSGGSNPVRAVLLPGSRFMYVLNRGVNAEGGSVCTTSDPCQNSNITQFAVGANGILAPQQTFYTQGINPFRILSDASGGYLMVLDHDAPSSAACKLVLGSAVTACGDITVFKIDSVTGRLSVVTNAQATSASGAPLTYFPVPADPIDFSNPAGYVLTLSGTPETGDSVFPYTSGANGQLTLNQNTSQPLGITQGTAMVNTGSAFYVLDNEPITIPSNTTSGFLPGTYPSQILPFTVGTGGSLQAQTSGIVPDDSTLANPVWLLQEQGSQGKFIYVANQGNNVQGNNAASGLAGYFLTTSPAFQLSFIAGEPWGSGAGPQCLVEDPSNQFVYTANYYDSTITGRIVDPNSGVLNPMRVQSKFNLPGPATWCLVDGRTN